MTTTTFSLAGILTQEGDMLSYEHPLHTKITFGAAVSNDVNKHLAFIKVLDQLISIDSVNTSMGFFVGDTAVPIDISPKDVIKIMFNIVYAHFIKADYYEHIKKELTRLSSRRGRRAIRRETKGSSGRSLKLDLETSPVLQFIASFLGTIWHHTLNGSWPDLELNFGAPNRPPTLPIYSQVFTQPHPDDDTITVSIMRGVDGGAIPDVFFNKSNIRSTDTFIKKVAENKKKNKRRRRK